MPAPARKLSRIHVGTSGWSYGDWKGRFYPKDLAEEEWLDYYASRFDTVELNASFYRLPFASMIESWNRRLPRHFHFVAKGSRQITHLKKLRDIRQPLERFLERILGIKTLRVLLWQLPPSLKKDLGRLERFLERLPRQVRHAFEFRHASWWDGDVRELLARHRAAFVSISHPTLPDDVVVAGDLIYLRFHGVGEHLYAHNYTTRQLQRWAERVRPHLKGRVLYAFFNNDVHAYAPKNALKFRELLAEAG